MIHHCVLLQWPHVFHVQYIKFNNFRFSPALEKKKNREQPLFQFQNCPRCEHFETYNITVLEPLSFSSRSHGPYLCGCNNGKVLLKQQSSWADRFTQATCSSASPQKKMQFNVFTMLRMWWHAPLHRPAVMASVWSKGVAICRKSGWTESDMKSERATMASRVQSGQPDDLCISPC